MNKKLFFLLSLFSAATSFSWKRSTTTDNTLLMGTIQFPRHATKSIKNLPGIRVYYHGNKITTETHDDAKSVSFTINVSNKIKSESLHVIITNNIEFETEKNTVKFLKTSPGTTYKLYKLTRKQVDVPDEHNDVLQKNQQTPTYTWDIERTLLQPDRRIPDNTLIVCLPCNYVEKLSGGSTIELPKIVIKNDFLKIAGSESNVHAQANELLLKLLDCDAIHSNVALNLEESHHLKKIVALS